MILIPSSPAVKRQIRDGMAELVKEQKKAQAQAAKARRQRERRRSATARKSLGEQLAELWADKPTAAELSDETWAELEGGLADDGLDYYGRLN